jgi:hypothetical protein
MTADEWRACCDPQKMSVAVNRRASDRKWRLVGCAFCRRIWPLLPHDLNRELVLAVEENPAGEFEDPDLNAAIRASSRVQSECAGDDAYWAAKYLGRSYYKFDPVTAVVAVASRTTGGDRSAERKVQAELIRCILGDPFRPVAFDPMWRSETAVTLARGIYDLHAFDRLPILADALEEVGCDHPEVLAHCRGPGPHARGCWVVDAVLGAE